MSDEAKRAAHLARRGVRGHSDPNQRVADMMKRDGAKWWPHPEGGKCGSYPDSSERGIWCAAGWIPDWDRNYPVYDIKTPDSRV